MLTLAFMGVWRVTLDGQPLTNLRSPRLQALLAYLVLEAAHAHPREVLAARFWPDESDVVAKQNLRQALYQLRQLLGESSEPFPPVPYLLVTRETVQFNPASPYMLDVTTFRTYLQQGQWQPAVDLYHGDLLSQLTSGSDRFAEWLLLQREQLHILALDALHQVTQQALDQNDYAQAQHYARRQLALEPWRESAHRQLMLTLARSGDRLAALAQYESCRRLLAVEVGVEPDAETVALAEQVRTGTTDKVTRWHGDKVTAQPDSVTLSPSHLVTQSPLHPVTDWGDAPESGTFYGRADELQHLHAWVREQRCRVVAVLGMGGMGKTTLAAQLARDCADQFDVVIWRSLLNAPTLRDLLEQWLRLLSQQQLAQLPPLDRQLQLLFDDLRQRRVLLILDNVESILQSGDRAGYYRPGYEEYGQLLLRFGQSQHQSTLLLTSREQPHELARLEAETVRVRSLPLAGLTAANSAQLLNAHGLHGPQTSTTLLAERYSGNPLALKLVADTVQDLFAGNIDAFLQDETLIFDDIRDVLDQQFGRLAALEQAILLWLAIAREPLAEAQLWQEFVHITPKRSFLEAIRSLLRRSLLENFGGAFGLQNVVTEYLTDYLINQVCQEFWQGPQQRLHSHPLLLVQAKAYIRQSQQRILLQPIGERLVGKLGRVGVSARCQQLLAIARQEQPLHPSFLAGNLLNILVHLGIDLSGYDFSHLCVWQAYLPGVNLRAVNFSGADLAHSRFTDTFAAIYTLAYAPDGALLAAGTANGGIRLWQIARGEPWAAIQDPAGTVYSVAFSPDGSLLASAGGDQWVRLWDVASQQLQATLAGPTNLIWSVAFSPDGRWLAAGDFDGNVIIWQLPTGQMVQCLPGHTAWVRKVLFTPDSQQLISTSRDGKVLVWDVRSGALQQSWPAHDGWVLSAAVSPNGKLLITGSTDQTARVWDLASGKLLATLAGHGEWVAAVAFQPQGAIVATASRDLHVRLWDVARAEIIRSLPGHTDFLHALAFAPDGETLASGGDDQTVRLWETRTGSALQTLHGYTFWMRAIAFSSPANGQPTFFAYAGIDHTIYLQPLAADGLPIAEDGPHYPLRGHKLLIIALAFSRDGRYLASAGADQAVRIWAVSPALTATATTPIAPLRSLPGHERIISTVAFSPDGDLIASGGEDGTVRLWEWQRGRVRFVLHGHDGGVNSVVFHPLGHLLASGSGDRTVRLWDVQSGEQVGLLTGNGVGLVRTIAFSPLGDQLASGGDDCRVRLWDIASRLPVLTLAGHEKYITAVAFSPDGQLLASTGADQTVRVWERTTGRQCCCLRGHNSVIYGLAFSPDGRLLATNSVDETVRFWDVPSGACVQTLRRRGPYADMQIGGATGISAGQQAALKALGAVE